ncbi:DUF6630 family protein [Paenibacillus sp. 1P07SE]|uniref:DUF6630 family protein n=1 Tax=Paenibacillus sp. 1P07SE TaxID=3132209 RepID=UPI0039A7566E
MSDPDFKRKGDTLTPIEPEGVRDPEYYEEESALLRLSRALAAGESAVAQEVGEALNYPAVYREKHEERLEERGLATETVPLLAWIALVDALIAQELALEIDWKDDGDTVLYAIGKLLDRKQLLAETRQLPSKAALEGKPTHESLQACHDRLLAQDVALACLDIDSDSYVLVVVPAGQFDELQELAAEAGYRLSGEYSG